MQIWKKRYYTASQKMWCVRNTVFFHFLKFTRDYKPKRNKSIFNLKDKDVFVFQDYFHNCLTENHNTIWRMQLVDRYRFTFGRNVCLILIIYCTITAIFCSYKILNRNMMKTNKPVQISITTTTLSPSSRAETQPSSSSTSSPLSAPSPQGLEHAPTLIKFCKTIRFVD